MIQRIQPDRAKGRSMIQAAAIDMGYQLGISPTIQSGISIIRGIYESFRMLGDALLTIRGKKAIGPDHHIEMIEELFTLSVSTARPMRALLNLKNLRRNINYEGYIPTLLETSNAMDFARIAFPPLLEGVKKECEKP